MRSIPVDTTKVQFIGTGKVAERAEYVELANGERRRSGNQATDENTGLPLYVVDVLVNDPDSQRAEIAAVKIPSNVPPETQMGQPVNFTDLVAVPYVDNRSNRVAMSFRATGIDNGNQRGGKAQNQEHAA